MTVAQNPKSKLSSQQQELLKKRLAQRQNNIPHQPHTGTAPASLAQSRLWLENELVPDSATYNITRRLHMKGQLDLPALEKSLNQIIRRHEILRTTFALQAEQIVQCIQPDMEIRLRPQPLPTAQANAVHRLALAEAQTPFNLNTGPLFRAQLLHLAAQEHILLFTLHHIIADGWSMNVLLQELAQHYQAYSQNQTPTLPPLTIQYADFARWQAQRLQTPLWQQQEAYWRNQLNHLPASLELPTDHPRPAQQTFTGATETFIIPASIAAPLQTLSQQNDTTLFMTLLAAFQVLLARYSGQKDIAIGTPVAGRNHPDLENLIGFFVNTIVLRGQLHDSPTFRDFLTRTRQTVLDGLSHQEMPFAQLVETLQPDRHLSHSPLFQVIFTLQNTPDTVLQLPGLTCTLEPIHSETAKYDLSLFVKEVGDTLECTWEYNTTLFDRATTQRLAANWLTLLAGIVAYPEQRVLSLPLLSESEQQQLATWNETQTPYPLGQMVHHLFEAQAAQTPEHTALILGDTAISYAELNQRANQLAHYLRRLDVGPETLVGLSLERSAEMIVGILAILKAGGAYLPLDAAYPAERLVYMLRDGQVKVLLTQESLRHSLPIDSTMTMLCLDSEWKLVTGESKENVGDAAASPHHLAYVMYTSGSTGHPKGVAVSHRNIIRLVKENNFAHLTADETLLQLAPISFDAATLEIWGSLLNGARLVIAPPQQLALPDIAALLQKHGVTTLWLTAGLFHLMVDNHLAALGGLRQLLAGGDVLSRPHVQRVLQELPACRLINGYGPTENTTFTTCYPLTPGESLESSVPIGRPIANTQVYILDENQALAPIGVPGELYTSGAGLARGYLNQPGLTAAAFIPHPFATQPGERLYRTGDLARWLPDGRIEFLGRRDHQIKIRGYRIEQDEIETVLNRHPAVRQAVILARTNPGGDKYLAAYVVSEQGDAAADQLHHHLAQHLPDYMIPTAWVFLDEFPLNPNGKVDRRALPEPDLSLRPLTTDLAQPTTPTEKLLTDIWSEVLGITTIGIHDNFFALGGHSLLATQIIARVRDKLQPDVPLLALFQHPTIAGFAAALTPHAMPETRPQIDITLRQTQQRRLIRQGREVIALPTSFAQQRLWSLDQLEPNSPLYNIPFPLHLEGELDETALQMALTDLVARHESLRTTFELVDDTPLQIIHPPDLLDLPFVSGDNLDAQINAAACQPFALSTGPLLRATLYQHDFDRHTLLLVFHHIITDGWSMPIFLDELVALYEEYATGTPANLTPLPLQYADFALWQREWLQGERLAEPLRYWRSQLAQAPAALELPTDHTRPALQTFNGDAFLFELPQELVTQLKTISGREGVTPYMVGLTVFFILLHRYTRQTDLVVGSPSANRTLPEQEPLIGFFVNMLALRADLSGNPTMQALLTQIREVVAAAQNHQEIPFEKLVNELGLERTLSHSPLFQVSFTYDVGGNRHLERAYLTWRTSDLGVGLVKYDLKLGLRESEQGIEGVISYNTDLFDSTTIKRMGQHYLNLLTAALAQPDHPIATLPLLTEAERVNYRQWQQATRRDYPLQTVMEQVVRIAAAQPDHPALVTATQTLTYDTLNRQANQLAHYLLEQGITPETLVAICLERSPLLAVAALAVWKAGGAYVPLDPVYPASRITFMFEDSRSPLLLTTGNVAAAYPSLECPLALLDDWSWLSAYPDNDPQPQTHLDHLAYLIYTSGSTGQPKGVAISQRSLANLIAQHQEAYPLTPDDRTTLVAGPAFDASVWELWSGLAVGAIIHIPDEETRLMPDKMRDWLVAQRITNTYLPTPLVNHLVHLPWPKQTPLCLMHTGGDVLHHYPPATLPFLVVNHYGPTEATVITTSMLLHPGQTSPTTLPLIGKAISNYQVYLLDAHWQPVPLGVSGELYIGGAGLARGYWQRPQLTATRFIPNPFSDAPGERLYRTGDLARYLPDGTLEFMGRVDQQVKIRGYRIELGEIETALSRHPGVREAAVVVQGAVVDHQRLVAYPVLTDPTLTSEQLRAYLHTHLPAYMVPAAFIPVSTIPLTPNGKVDRDALPPPDTLPDTASPYAAPATSVEQTLAAIWQTVLGLEQIGLHDNFFELGGDSILSIRIVAKAKEAGLQFTVRQMFQHQTIAELAAVLGDTSTPALAPIAIPNNEPAPLTPIQQWFFEQTFANPNHWNMALLLEMTRPLNQTALQQAILALETHHDALRLRFTQTATGWQQHPDPDSHQECLHWLTGVTDTAPIIAAQQASLDMSHGPLWRVVYLDRGRAPHQLLLIAHHLVMDGISWRILLEDLQTAYQQAEQGATITLPTPTASFPQWAHALAHHVQNGAFTAQPDLWQAHLSVPGDVPLDNPGGHNTVASEVGLTWTLTPDETDALLHELPHVYNTRPDDVLLTALAQAYHTWTGYTALRIHMEGHGREEILPHLDITRTIGWFTTLYPVSLHLTGTGQPGDDLKAIKEQLRQIPERGISYGLLRYLHPDKAIRGMLAEGNAAAISFNYLGQFNEQNDAAALFHIVAGASATAFAPQNQRPHLLDVSGVIHNRQLQISLRYSRELHHESTIARFGEALMQQLRELIRHGQSPQVQGYTPSDFDKISLSQTELDDILAELSDIL